MNVQPQEAGEEVEASLHGRIAFPFHECNTVRQERVGYIGIGIREVTVRIRIQKRNERGFSRTPPFERRLTNSVKILTSKGRRASDKPKKRFKDLARTVTPTRAEP